MANVRDPYQRTTKERLIELADKILLAWRGYTDEDAFILQRQRANHTTRSLLSQENAAMIMS